MITLLAKAKVQEGREKEFEDFFARILAKVKETEPDTLLYKLCRSQKLANEYHMIEFYRAKESLKFHMNNPATKDLMDAVGPLFAEAPQVSIIDDVLQA